MTKEEINVVTKELSYWASFFEDPTMNRLTVSERLRERVKQLNELL